MVHYLEDLVPLFKEVHRVLKQGGQFIFSTHHPLVDFEDNAFNNYFAVERITEDWNTVGEPVEVSFFRRSFTNLFDSLAESGFTLDKFSEGQPDPAMKEVSPETFDKLSRRPNFIFYSRKRELTIAEYRQMVIVSGVISAKRAKNEFFLPNNPFKLQINLALAAGFISMYSYQKTPLWILPDGRRGNDATSRRDHC